MIQTVIIGFLIILAVVTTCRDVIALNKAEPWHREYEIFNLLLDLLIIAGLITILFL